MDKSNEFKSKLQAFGAKSEPFRSKAGKVIGKIAFVFGVIGKWLYRLRGIWLAIPVAIAAVALAIRNNQLLPETVGINILSTGEYQWMVERSTAVMAPLLVTAVCLLLMFCSRKVAYPWLISVFTLVLPIVIYITNVFPA